MARPTRATKQHFDSLNDNPRLAFPEMATNVDAQNSIIAYLGATAPLDVGQGLRATAAEGSLEVRIEQTDNVRIHCGVITSIT